MSRPRLCFVGWADHVHVERWAGYFARTGYDVCVVSFSDKGEYPGGVRQYAVGLHGRGPRWIELKLRYLFARIRPDVVHVHWAHFAVPVRNAWKGPLVVSAWGSDVYRRDRFSDRQWSDLGSALRAADLVTCDSNDLATAIACELSVPPSRIAVIQWGVDTDLFAPQGDDLRAKFGLQGREVVFSARNFTPLYNQETVVEAFDRLRRDHPAAFLLMKNHGGDVDYVAKIRTLLDVRGLAEHARIVGTVPYEAMPKLYRSTDVTVSIPFSDATPMALLEAMACGSLPVVSDLASLREWIIDGENGFLVDPKDVTTVIAALRRALAPSDRCIALRSAARAAVVAKASQRAHMDVAAAHYRRLAAA